MTENSNEKYETVTIFDKKRSETMNYHVSDLFQQGMRESNSHQRFWRPLSYHLTNPLCLLLLKLYIQKRQLSSNNIIFLKRRWRDLNSRAGYPTYRISSADPSATWVHLRIS